MPNAEWPYLEILIRLALSLALGLLIGLERERRGKEAGLRTFGFIALLGALGGSLGTPFALLVLALVGMLAVILNVQTLRADQGTELTTSAAMLVTCMAGILCGQGHTISPAAVMVIATALLAWKERLAGFSMGLTEGELRSALLLAILAIVIYPALPSGAIDPVESGRPARRVGHGDPDRRHRLRELHPLEAVRRARHRALGLSRRAGQQQLHRHRAVVARAPGFRRVRRVGLSRHPAGDHGDAGAQCRAAADPRAARAGRLARRLRLDARREHAAGAVELSRA